jgi:hypothetical protein
MDDLLKPRDLRNEVCQPMPEGPSRFGVWATYQQRWREANEYKPEEFAFLWLTVPLDSTSLGHKPWLPFVDYTNDQLTELVKRSETDRDAFEYLRAWLAGELIERDSPEQIPSILSPFVQRLAAGKKPGNRGKGKVASKRNARLRPMSEALKARYGLPLYRSNGNTEGTTCVPIAMAVSRFEDKTMTPMQVYEVLHKGG